MRRFAVTLGVIVGLAVAVPSVFLLITRDTVARNCQEIEVLKGVIRGVLAQSVAHLGQPGTAGYVYYRSHPGEIVLARRQVTGEIAKFHPLRCT